MNQNLINPLWTYSLKLYSSEDIKQLCHLLQDNYDANVNIILWCCWYAASDYGQTSEELLKRIITESAIWQDNVTRQLREIRHWLKDKQKNDLILHYGKQVMELELTSEAIQQKQFYDLSVNQAKTGENIVNDARINLQIYFNTLSSEVKEDLWNLIETNLLPKIA